MPYAAPRVCARCRQLVPAGQTCDCRPPWEGSPQRAARSTRWAKRRRAQLKLHGICQWPGCRVVATEVDHITPIGEGGDEYAWHNLQNLCGAHHQQKTTADALRGKRRARGRTMRGREYMQPVRWQSIAVTLKTATGYGGNNQDQPISP
jgi:5-methylcytosine-specific restriction protein A